MTALGIICLVVSACYFCNAGVQDYVTHATTLLLGWLGFGVAGMGFLILGRLNALLTTLQNKRVVSVPPNENKNERSSL